MNSDSRWQQLSASGPAGRFDQERSSIEQIVFTAAFVGASSDIEIVGEDMIDYKCNYFLDNDPSKWRTSVPSYASLLFKNLYHGIDLRYFDAGSGTMGYEFIAAPDADLRQIQVEYEGADEISVDESGRQFRGGVRDGQYVIQ